MSWAAPVCLVWVGCSDFAWNRARYDAAVEQGLTALVAAAPSVVPGCEATVATFRTPWAVLPRGGPNDPNGRSLHFPDGQRLVQVLETDVHGYRRAYLFTGPPASAARVSLLLDTCGGGEWEGIDPLGDGWFVLESRLD